MFICHMCQGLNSHYFHIIGDKLINPIVGVYIPIIRIPIKGGRFPIPNIATTLTVAHIYCGEADSLNPDGIFSERHLPSTPAFFGYFPQKVPCWFTEAWKYATPSHYHPLVKQHGNGISPFLLGKKIHLESRCIFQPAMLVYQSVCRTANHDPENYNNFSHHCTHEV